MKLVIDDETKSDTWEIHSEFREKPLVVTSRGQIYAFVRAARQLLGDEAAAKVKIVRVLYAEYQAVGE